MGLAATELRDQREYWSAVFGLAGQSPQHHAGMLAKRAREARTREELHRVAVVFRGRAPYDLFQRDGELVGIK
jgi:hypothetical protein